MLKRKPKSIAPFKASTKRRPGQSLLDNLNDQINDLMGIFAVVLFAAPMLGLHLFAPQFTTLFLACAIGCGIIFIAIRFPRLIRIGKGHKAERKVGDIIQTMERQDCLGLHDLVFDNFNNDHVIISRAGVFVIESIYVGYALGRNKKLNYKNGFISLGSTAFKKSPCNKSIGLRTL